MPLPRAIFETLPEKGTDKIMPLLSVSDISIIHRSSKALLIKDISLSLESGERLDIVY
jgi:ABC-type transport system involved in cytochrome bd biosynthesis fused ATPase/permease subunit